MDASNIEQRRGGVHQVQPGHHLVKIFIIINSPSLYLLQLSLLIKTEHPSPAEHLPGSPNMYFSWLDERGWKNIDTPFDVVMKRDGGFQRTMVYGKGGKKTEMVYQAPRYTGLEFQE